MSNSPEREEPRRATRDQASGRGSIEQDSMLCQICLEKLSKNPLGSTICGHVFCLSCIEIALKHDEHCPTCRRILKGAHAYHPLYPYYLGNRRPV